MTSPSRKVIALGNTSGEQRVAVEAALRKSSVELSISRESVKALTEIEREPALAVLFDTALLGSEQFCRKVRTSERLRGVPIIALTRSGDEAACARAFAWGADDVIAAGSEASLVDRLAGLDPAAAGDTLGLAVIAEPHADRAAALSRALAHAGYQVKRASDAKSAETLASDGETRLVLMAATFTLPRALIERVEQSGALPLWVVTGDPDSLSKVAQGLEDVARVVLTSNNGAPEDVLFAANELVFARGSKRKEGRALFGAHVVFRQAGSQGGDAGFTYDVSAGGLYVRSLLPFDEKDVELELTPPRRDKPVTLRGKVIRRFRFASASIASAPAGFAVRLEGNDAALSAWKEACSELVEQARATWHDSPTPICAASEGPARRPTPNPSALPGRPLPANLRARPSVQPAADREPPAPEPDEIDQVLDMLEAPPKDKGRDSMHSDVGQMLADTLGSGPVSSTGARPVTMTFDTRTVVETPGSDVPPTTEDDDAVSSPRAAPPPEASPKVASSPKAAPPPEASPKVASSPRAAPPPEASPKVASSPKAAPDKLGSSPQVSPKVGSSPRVASPQPARVASSPRIVSPPPAKVGSSPLAAPAPKAGAKSAAAPKVAAVVRTPEAKPGARSLSPSPGAPRPVARMPSAKATLMMGAVSPVTTLPKPAETAAKENTRRTAPATPATLGKTQLGTGPRWDPTPAAVVRPGNSPAPAAVGVSTLVSVTGPPGGGPPAAAPRPYQPPATARAPVAAPQATQAAPVATAPSAAAQRVPLAAPAATLRADQPQSAFAATMVAQAPPAPGRAAAPIPPAPAPQQPPATAKPLPTEAWASIAAGPPPAPAQPAPSSSSRGPIILAAILGFAAIVGAVSAAFLLGLLPPGGAAANRESQPERALAPTTTPSAAPSAVTTASAAPVETAAPPAKSAPAPEASAAPAESAAAPTESAPAPAESAPAPEASAPAADAPLPEVDLSALAANQGYLYVRSSATTKVFVMGKEVGETNQPLVSTCGPRFVRLGPKLGHFIEPGGSMVIKCGELTEVKREPR